MPIIPSVFQPIKANDFQRRPIKAYKHYYVSDVGFVTESGYFRHDALYRKHTPHIFAHSGTGVCNLLYPHNTEDNTNKHVVWNTVDARYYRRNNPAFAFDWEDIENQTRKIWVSASVLTMPYHQVGEKIKHGTLQITSSLGTNGGFNLKDDGLGNLRDPLIDSGSFASSSRNFFYMSFNDQFRNFNEYKSNDSRVAGYAGSNSFGNITGSKAVTYRLNGVEKLAAVNGDVEIADGIEVTGTSGSGGYLTHTSASGLAASWPVSASGGFIRIPNDDKFDRFNHCDDWTISFWYKNTAITPGGTGGIRFDPIITKLHL